ncbi:protein ALP1-like [Aphidius gifuensis]|uniref:protein ALP1-like n=1 Tax=Aphidius gifuensis TaxID=684658 RepID=UPI001CDB9E52|nr:protein ALP1-like [Aphidius gifuensis]
MTSVADRFGLRESTLWRCVQRVTNALTNIAHHIIAWPTRACRREISAAFEAVAGLPNVIGAIDGASVQIKAPSVDREVYVTRKFFTAYTVQGISDSNLKFIDIYTGWPGSVSDTRIFRNLPIYHDVMANRAEFFDDNEYILGDKAYPVLDWCIPPFINRGNLTEHQTRFNTAHARQRAVIERAWALLFGRFRRLKFLDMTRENLISSTILACCVLYNICLDHQEVQLFEYENEGHLFMIGNENDQERERVELNLNATQIRGLQRQNELCHLIHARHVAQHQN